MKIMPYIYFSVLVLISSASYAENYSGAVAINLNTGVTGGARNYSTEEDAGNRALGHCNKKNKMRNGCKLVLTFSNACGAVAWATGNHFAFSDWHDHSLQKAKDKAMAGCRASGGVGCRIAEAFCTSWEVNETVWW